MMTKYVRMHVLIPQLSQTLDGHVWVLRDLVRDLLEEEEGAGFLSKIKDDEVCTCACSIVLVPQSS